jgi:hypothetical protein
MVFRRRRRSNNPTTHSNPETGATAPTDKPSGGGSSSLPEMPAPDVPPRPAYSELPVVGPWVVRPELQGGGSGGSNGSASGAGTPYSGAASSPPPPPVSPASLGEGWLGGGCYQQQ